MIPPPQPSERKPFFAIKLVIIGVVLIAVIGFIAAGIKNQSNEAPEFSIGALQLWQEYQANEIGADSKYKGHVVLIEGRIGEIGKTILGTPFLEYKIFRGDSVQCEIASESIELAGKLHRGEYIKVVGRIRGLTLGSVYVEDCVIQPSN